MPADKTIAAAELGSLVDLLRHRAAVQPDDRAYLFLPDRGGAPAELTFGGLFARARTVAQRLAERGCSGDRAALLFPPGLDFIVAFFGCLLAGRIAIPMMVPRRRSLHDASAAILADCSARWAITSRGLIEGARPDLIERLQDRRLEWLLTDPSDAPPDGPESPLSVPERSDIAFLQYTSGSTSAPKGVIVSHGNLLDNSEMIRRAFGNTRQSTYVSWVPLYHDMGLIVNVLQSLYVGALCVLLPPVAFLQRPLGWLRAIHDYRAEVAGGPNFAFDLCVRRHRVEEMQGIDLSSWKLAYNGAEPVRADTIARFAATFAPYGFDARTAYPAYGMAEATLLISGGARGAEPVTRTISGEALQRHRAVPPACPGDSRVVVGCGRRLEGECLAIVEPQSRRRLAPCLIGEVWVAGRHVAQGYWRNPEATDAVFGGQLDGDGADGRRWLRTGDLGFLDEEGELYITGRIKDLIIIRGINHYPQDIENTVEECHPALRRHGGAAFTVLDGNDGEQLIVVQEVERSWQRLATVGEIAASIREAIATEHDIAAKKIVLIRPGTLPQTTSGKIQRHLARQQWLAGALAVVE